MVVGSLTLGVLSSITEFEPMLSGYALYLVSRPMSRFGWRCLVAVCSISAW